MRTRSHRYAAGPIAEASGWTERLQEPPLWFSAVIRPTALGTEGDDTFVGTRERDYFRALEGDDTIDGRGGNDQLNGNEGDDVIRGGRGDDLIKGEKGDDQISCGKGNDRVEAIGSKNDRDVIHGNAGDDYLMANADDQIFGGVGDDYLQAGGAYMDGGRGDDYLYIISPFSIYYDLHEVRGGSGADTFHFLEEINGTGVPFAILDLALEDYIDLANLDANQDKPDNQLFRIVEEFDGRAGELTISYDAEQDRTLIQFYTDRDEIADGVIWAPGDVSDLDHSHFLGI